MPTTRTPLDILDEQFRDTQDRLAAAIDREDSEAIVDARAEAGAVSVTDAEGVQWRVNAPRHTGTVEPYFRFHYRYWAGLAGDDLRPIDRRRFAPAPLLARAYANSLGSKGWLPAVIRNAEPLGYVGGGAIGVGLWFLLGDIIGSLPGWSVLVGMVLLAAGLWLSTVRLTTVGYREALRLGHVTRAAAVGVTGALPWVVTIDAEWITDVGRVAVTASVVTLSAALSYLRTSSVVTYSIALVGWVVAMAATSTILVEDVLNSSLEFLTAPPGMFLAVALAVPVLTMVGSARWIPASVISLTVVTSLLLFLFATEEATTTEALWGAFGGAIAASTIFGSRKLLRAPMRRFHIVCAAVIAGTAVLVAVARMPWDVFGAVFEWLADVPLPIVLITAGSVLLIVVAWVVRVAVRRVGTSTPDNE